MLKLAGCLIAVLAGVGVLCGLGLRLTAHSGDTVVVVAVPGCGQVSVAYGFIGDDGALSVRADACRPPGTAALLTEQRSFASVGASVWRTPGPAVDTIAITLDRSTERPDGAQPPRTLVLSGDEAAARWGSRPVAPAPAWS